MFQCDLRFVIQHNVSWLRRNGQMKCEIVPKNLGDLLLTQPKMYCVIKDTKQKCNVAKYIGHRLWLAIKSILFATLYPILANSTRPSAMQPIRTGVQSESSNWISGCRILTPVYHPEG